MKQAGRRGFLMWVAIPLIAAQVGCATREVRVSPAAEVSEADRKTCEAFAQAEVGQGGKTATGAYVKTAATEVLLAALFFIPTLGVSAFVAPVGLFIDGPKAARKTAAENRATYDQAMRTCLEPGTRARALGPDHPDVAASLAHLASRYVALGDHARAEPLYRQALSIQERALGPDHADIVRTLADYAVMLRKTGRAGEADEMEDRARAMQSRLQPPPTSPEMAEAKFWE